MATLIWARMTGKTTGPISDKLLDNMNAMPRSLGGLLSYSYVGLMTNILPQIISSWQKYGYYENIHYWIGKKPPEKLKIPNSYYNIKDYTHLITRYDGSQIALMSADRALYNGKNIDYLVADELRLQGEEKVREIELTVRGNAEYFGHLACHGSRLYTTDMPRGADQQWVLRARYEMDSEVIEGILLVQAKIAELKWQIEKSKSNDRINMLYAKIADYETYLNKLRMGTTYFSVASALDNIHSVGFQAIKNLKKILSDKDFQISILNKELVDLENGFYGLLNENHFYDAPNFHNIDKAGSGLYTGEAQRDCSWDSDVNPHKPLDVACDYGARINCLVVGQRRNKKDYNILKDMFVSGQDRIGDLANKFAHYYKYHSNKIINYYYDHTAIGGNNMVAGNAANTFATTLRKHGWIVNEHYIGQATTHNYRYHLWQDTFAGKKPNFFPLFNRTNCSDLKTAMENANKLYKGTKEIAKDKSSEKPSSKTLAQHSTHLTEALDMLRVGKEKEL